VNEIARRDAMELAQQHAREAIASQRVFGDPIERDGVMIIPVASVQGGGGGGGGGGEGPDGGGSGSGGGFGMHARPVGVYVVKNGQVHWEPALDLGRVIAGAQALAAVALLLFRTSRRRRRRGRS
jgi:uncharacterized spore protein YtfJ